VVIGVGNLRVASSVDPAVGGWNLDVMFLRVLLASSSSSWLPDLFLEAGIRRPLEGSV